MTEEVKEVNLVRRSKKKFKHLLMMVNLVQVRA